jgi:hypothetical protein
MCDISFTNGKGLLGQVINKIHEDKIINTPLELETYLIKRDNDIVQIPLDTPSDTQNVKDVKILSDIQRWLYIFHSGNYQNSENNQNSVNMDLLIKRSSVLEDAIKILINEFSKLNNEFLELIHITDKDKLTNLQLTEIYDVPISTLLEKWNLLLKYQSIFKNLIHILDENMKKTVQIDGI